MATRTRLLQTLVMSTVTLPFLKMEQPQQLWKLFSNLRDWKEAHSLKSVATGYINHLYRSTQVYEHDEQLDP